MAKKTLFMETTKIKPEQTVGEIQKVLGKYGARAILMQYDKGEITAVSFQLNVANKDIAFKLPCRPEAIYQFLIKRRANMMSDQGIATTLLQAKRIAWRQILRWVEAQLALVETDMVKIQEVFMPYIQVNIKGQTLYEKLEESKFKMIEDKSGK